MCVAAPYFMFCFLSFICGVGRTLALPRNIARCVLHLHQHHAGAVSLCIFVCSFIAVASCRRCLCYFRLLFLCKSYQLKASTALRSGLSISRIMPLPSWLVSSLSFCSPFDRTADVGILFSPYTPPYGPQFYQNQTSAVSIYRLVSCTL